MKPIRPLLSALLGLAAIGAGCGAQTQSDLVVSSDAELAAMAAGLLPDLARRSGMELREPVRIEARSRAELERYLTAKLDEDLPEADARDRVAAYALLGLVPEDTDLRALLLGLYGEQVAGFYEPDSTALYVLDDQPPGALQALLVHELVHAVHDQSTDLHALTDPENGNDRSTAAMAAVEGHATLVMFEYLTEQMTGAPVDLGAIPDFAAQVGPALESMTAQFPALASAPRVIRESLIFPYVDGAGYVQRLWRSGERASPFGDELPRSTEQVVSPGAAPPLGVAVTPEERPAVLDDTLGSLELRILAEDVLGLAAPDAAALASAWDGDRWVLMRGGAGVVGLAFATVWSDAGARDRFVTAANGPMARFGGAARAHALEVDGRPGSLVLVGALDDDVTVALVPSS
jgi:hypothetical protein